MVVLFVLVSEVILCLKVPTSRLLVSDCRQSKFDSCDITRSQGSAVFLLLRNFLLGGGANLLNFVSSVTAQIYVIIFLLLHFFSIYDTMRMCWWHIVMDLDFENCENLCAKSASPSQIVMLCGSTKHSDIFEISNRLVLLVFSLNLDQFLKMCIIQLKCNLKKSVFFYTEIIIIVILFLSFFVLFGFLW